MDEEFGRLEQVPVRVAWKDEARDFTPWLARNLDRLGEQLGLALELRSVEHAVGRYALDILAEDAVGRVVVVENQLEPSDHVHLGQLLTYCAGTGAKVVVWVAPSFTDEHLAALTWLNENTVADVAFFAVEVQLLRIGNSPSAPRFEPVVRPNEWLKEARPAAARAEWDWHAYADELLVPQDQIATGRRLVDRIVEVADSRRLAWQPRFNKGYVSIQRAGGYNVLFVDVSLSRPVRLAVRLPADPETLGLVNPFPHLEAPWWVESNREWCWHIPSNDAPLVLDLGPLFDIAQQFVPTQDENGEAGED